MHAEYELEVPVSTVHVCLSCAVEPRAAGKWLVVLCRVHISVTPFL
jgi:hypothetical protein